MKNSSITLITLTTIVTLLTIASIAYFYILSNNNSSWTSLLIIIATILSVFLSSLQILSFQKKGTKEGPQTHLNSIRLTLVVNGNSIILEPYDKKQVEELLKIAQELRPTHSSQSDDKSLTSFKEAVEKAVQQKLRDKSSSETDMATQ